MTAAETQHVKLAAKSLLNRLRDQHPNVLVQDWHTDEQSQLKVKSTVEEVLDATLPDTYNRMLFKSKCDTIFNLIYTSAQTGQKWAG